MAVTNDLAVAVASGSRYVTDPSVRLVVMNHPAW